jgi:hypothetical protein
MNSVFCELLMLGQIDFMKHKMIKLANSTGINSDVTIRCSQELDTLLNLHMKHFSKKNIMRNAS